MPKRKATDALIRRAVSVIRFSPISLSRDEFLDWAGGHRANLSSAGYVQPGVTPEGRQVTLLVNSKKARSSDQPIVAVPGNEMDEFFAFTSTYIATSKPYSAFYHVIPLELTSEIEARRPLDLTKVTSFARIVAGAARAEAYLASRSRLSQSFASEFALVNSTLSVALGAAAIAGYVPNTISWIARQWNLLRSGGEPDKVSANTADAISQIWRLLFSAVRNETEQIDSLSGRSVSVISEFIQVALNVGVTGDLLRVVGRALPSGIDMAEMLAASREERIKSFTYFVATLGEGDSDSFERAFMAGLMLAIAGNGSFDMLRSGRELADRSPTSIIWFGICAALFEESNVLTGANCVGRRVARDLASSGDVFDLPKADIGIFEYRSLARDLVTLEQINVSSIDSFCVEILPNVVTYVPRESVSRDSHILEDYQFITDGVREIKYVVDRVARRLDRSGDPRQRDMYSEEAKSRRRSR